MIRRREYTTREMLPALPKEQYAHFLALDPAERKLLMNGSDEEREQYGWLPPGAAKKYARLPECERQAEAKAAARERRRAQAPAPVQRTAPKPPADLNESAVRVAESVRDIFELGEAARARAQSIAANCLQCGDDEEQALDRVAQWLMNDAPLKGALPSPTRMELMFGRGKFLRP